MKYLVAPMMLALPVMAVAESDAVDAALCQQVFGQVNGAARGALTVESVRAEGTQCVMEGLVVDMPGNYDPDFFVDRVAIEGRGFAAFFADQTPMQAVTLDVDNLRIIPQTQDPFFDYMMRVQQARNVIDVDLSVAWDPATKTLRMDRFDIDFVGDDAVSVRFVAENADLSSRAALEMSITALAVTELDIEVTSNGLFEGYAFPILANLFLGSAQDPEAEMEALKAFATEGLDLLPEASFDAQSRAALAAVIGDMPHPGGTLALSIRAEPGIGAVRMGPVALSGVPRTAEDLELVMDGVTVDVTYDRQPIE